jgi:hypothetical protein
MDDRSTSAGDTWLAREVPQLLITRQYLAGQTVIFMTWDKSRGLAAAGGEVSVSAHESG